MRNKTNWSDQHCALLQRFCKFQRLVSYARKLCNRTHVLNLVHLVPQQTKTNISPTSSRTSKTPPNSSHSTSPFSATTTRCTASAMGSRWIRVKLGSPAGRGWGCCRRTLSSMWNVNNFFGHLRHFPFFYFSNIFLSLMFLFFCSLPIYWSSTLR